MPDQIASLVDFSDAKALFTDEDIWGELKSQPMPQVESVISLEDWGVLGGKKGDFNKSSLPLREELEVGFPKSSPDSLAMICFTSGTSGSAKGVMLSYGNITASVTETAKAYIEPVIKTLPMSNKNSTAFLPIAHAFGWGGNMIPLTYGIKINLCSHPLLPEIIVKILRITHSFLLFIVPTTIQSVIKGQFDVLDIFKDVKFLVVGGAQFITGEQKLIKAGVPISLVYGTTETTAPITLSPKIGYRIGSCGRIIDTLSARISPEGEILVKGENVMLGYYKDPEATARKIDSDGWLHTGDKGHLDEDGYLYVEGRLEQDIIVLPNGENIRPDNIESLINALPEVSESIVLARDGKLVAIVVPKITNDQSSMTNTDLRRMILRNVNPSLPLYSQLYDVEITDTPLAKTEKQTIKRYLYK
jgi:long-chain acyl-CoA synthetase